MVIDLKPIYDAEGQSYELDYSISEERLGQIRGFVLEDFSVKGKVYNRAGIVHLNYSGAFTLKAECDRCLRPFNRSYQFDSKHILVRTVNTDNDEYIVTQGDSIDVDELAVQDALLQLPTKLLCRQDCKGLCYVCGADLNLGECGCDRQQ